MTLDQPKEFVVQEKRDAKARLVINDELSSVCHCCTALNIGAKVSMNSHSKIPTDLELSNRLLLSFHSIIAVSVYPSLINSWLEARKWTR